MSFINNLPLRGKLLLIVFPILAGLVYFAYFSARESYKRSTEMDTLAETVQVSVELGVLAHEIQKERGNSSGFLSSNGERFGESLSKQRILTNNVLRELPNLFAEKKATVLAPYQKEITALIEMLDNVQHLRVQVDDQEIAPNDAIGEYTKINTLALSIVERFGNEIQDVDMFSQLLAYSSFLKSKERAGIERALGTQGFVLNKLPLESYQWYNQLVAEQNTLTNIFLNNSRAEEIAFYQKNFDIPSVKEVDRMRLLLTENESLSESPEYWFEQITLKINALKAVEDYLVKRVSSKSSSLAAEATASLQFTVISTAITTILVVVLLFTILTNVLGNIKKLSAFSNIVAKGNLKAKIAIGSKDELGVFANTMNRMIGS